MKLKNNIYKIFNLKIFLILFIFSINYKAFSSEKNYVIATINRSPITYFDLKQKAKLMHFLNTKNNEYKNLNKFFKLAFESLISQKLLMTKALEFNKNILKLTKEDATKYILTRYNNSPKVFNNFLKQNKLSKSVVITNVQIEIIKKYLIGQMFEKEYDDYLKEIRDNSIDNNNAIDLEQIIIRVDKKNLHILKSIDNQINTLSNEGYSFKEIANILSKNNLIKVSAGRTGWQNKNNFKLNTFKKLFEFPEGKIIKEKFDDNLNYLRIISKRENGKISNREQIIDLIRISYLNSKKNQINLKRFSSTNSMLSCKDVYAELYKKNILNIISQKINLTNFSEKILLMIQKSNVKQFTDPILFKDQSVQFYICDKIIKRKKTTSENVYDEKKLTEKVNILTNKILKILKKDAIIDIKIKINELN